jgi:hypothetical protein
MLSITTLEINRQRLIFLVIDQEECYRGIMFPVIVQEPTSRRLNTQRSLRLKIHRARRHLKTLKGLIPR